ncbi:hypothetical protein LCM17_21050 [Cereibacter sphaeroides]|nr:hypothetical protein [Cereibacter sphaeroides]
MGKGKFSDAFMRDAVAQITERGYARSSVAAKMRGLKSLGERVAARAPDANTPKSSHGPPLSIASRRPTSPTSSAHPEPE